MQNSEPVKQNENFQIGAGSDTTRTDLKIFVEVDKMPDESNRNVRTEE
ncbi:MAG: hypothetical protein FWF80_07360 [Defluviitaleaceae bacterium]|nr:hypothetical protein [Defluviitaleaceae bacterium]